MALAREEKKYDSLPYDVRFINDVREYFSHMFIRKHTMIMKRNKKVKSKILLLG
jgi:hypothetical protein